VLNHKRGHLRDLENAFKVTLSIVSDPNVGGLQSYIIDRGEQVHTLEAAKALLAAQASAAPVQAEEAPEEDELFDAEFESEVETEETEGLTEEAAAREGGEGEDQDGQGQRRRRRRRRRGRGGEGRDAAPPREDGETVVGEQNQAPETTGEEGDIEEEEAEEQPGLARGDNQGGDNQGNGERRPRRRGRRGGRRRRGSGEQAEDGLAGSISDELAAPPAPEAADAAADFDGVQAEEHAPQVQPDPVAPATQPVHQAKPESVSSPSSEPVAEEDDKPAPRRSTVREKVSFASTSVPAEEPPAAAVPDTSPSAIPTEPAAAAEASSEPQPRKAGWWSRRFGGGQ